MDDHSCVLVPSVFGDLGVVWTRGETAGGARVRRILLPNERPPTRCVVQVPFSDAGSSLPPAIASLSERLQRFLAGGVVEFGRGHLELLALDACSAFQRRVLLAEYGIPRGWVSTYGRVAKHIGCPGGARAVGNALARNPFPIIIPCHRAVRADGCQHRYNIVPKTPTEKCTTQTTR